MWFTIGKRSTIVCTRYAWSVGEKSREWRAIVLHRNSRNMILLAIVVLCAVGLLVAGDHEEIQKLKLEDLADGETRTFGEGDHKVTVTRKGDLLTVKIDDLEEAHGKHMLWVGEDGKVITLEGGDADNVMIKTSGDGTEIEKEVHVIRIGEDGEKHAENITIDVMKEGGEPHVIKMISKGDHEHGDKIVLRCPEGDTTMVLDKDEAEETYLCPKHKSELQPVAHKVIKKKVEVQAESFDHKHE